MSHLKEINSMYELEGIIDFLKEEDIIDYCEVYDLGIGGNVEAELNYPIMARNLENRLKPYGTLRGVYLTRDGMICLQVYDRPGNHSRCFLLPKKHNPKRIYIPAGIGIENEVRDN